MMSKKENWSDTYKNGIGICLVFLINGIVLAMNFAAKVCLLDNCKDTSPSPFPKIVPKNWNSKARAREIYEGFIWPLG